MIKIGITGEMGSGKSYCSKLFEKLGVPVFNSDDVAKKVINTTPELRHKICQEFGNVYDDDGLIITHLIRSFIFTKGNEGNLEKLNSIVHPYVFFEYERFCQEHSDKKYTIAESAILYESGMNKVVDKVIYVMTDEETRIKRTFERSGISEDEYRQRMRDQVPNKEKLSDITITNNDGSDVESQIISIHRILQETL